MPLVSIHHLAKTFEGNTKVLKDISFDVNEGECLTIIGPSGSGKSTLLRCINRLETPSSGEILYKGENILDPKYDVNSLRSHISRVFQSFNLFNNRDVLENCVIGQRKVLHRKKKEAEEAERLTKLKAEKETRLQEINEARETYNKLLKNYWKDYGDYDIGSAFRSLFDIIGFGE